MKEQYKAVVVWSQDYRSPAPHPKFYERIDEKVVRVSNQRGKELIAAGIIDESAPLQNYFKFKNSKKKK